MPARSATQSALQSLLSIQNIPPKLISQADSLLNISRQRAANLKPEEEIARAHACAEIAAKRSRLSLRLPSIKSGAGAPAKPGVYKKLVGFLEGVLLDAGNGTPTSGKKRSVADLEEGSIGSSAKRPKTKDNGPKQEVEGTPTKKRKVVDASRFFGAVKKNTSTSIETSSTPDYTMPSIRKLCNKFDTPRIAPHALTGVSIILKEAELWPVEEEQDEKQQSDYRQNILSLIIAVYLMVLTRMKKGKMTTAAYTTTSTQGIEVLGLHSKTSSSAGPSIHEWISKINNQGWATDQDWWDSVPENVIDFPARTVGSGTESADLSSAGDMDALAQVTQKQTPLKRGFDFRQRLDEPDPEGVLLPGLGTMMQDAVDFLSEDRRTDFVQWKASIEKRMNALDKQQGAKRRGVAVS